MNVKQTVGFLTLTLMASAAHAGDAEKVQIRELGRELGYGGAIHNFKNYVLRATDSYRTEDEAHLTKAAVAIATLRAGNKLSAEEKEALDAVEFVIDTYRRGSTLAQKLVAAGRTPEQIDQSVKIADAPAIWGLEVLRKGQTWTPFETLEHQLGFGGAIHNFKNYVLRASVGTRDAGGNADSYRANADTQFGAIEKALAAMEKDKTATDEDKAAVKGIGGVVKQYKANLAKVKQLAAQKKSVKDIDAVVKVDDAPALAGLAVFRKK